MAWAAMAAAMVPVGLWTQAQVGAAGGLAGLDGRQWAAHASQLARSWLTTIPYLAFTVWAATLARGAGPALALGMATRFAEVFSGTAGLLLAGFGMGMEGLGAKIYRLWAPLHVASMEWNASVWRTWGKPYDIYGELPSPLHTSPWLAALVLLLWTTAWVGLATQTLKRRDITG